MKRGISILLVALMLSGPLISLVGMQNSDAAASVASSWPMLRGNPQHTGLSPYDTSNNNGGFLWNYSIGWSFHTEVSIGPDGTIYERYGGSHLIALNPDGTLKWNYTEEGFVSDLSCSTPTIGPDGTIYVGFSDGLTAFNLDGKVKWIGDIATGSVVIGSDGTIYGGGSSSNYLYALYPNGTLKWTYAPTSDFNTNNIYGMSSPAIGADGTLYTTSSDRHLYAVNPDGTGKWNFTTGAEISTLAVVGSDGTIYFGSRDSSLYAVDSSGNLKWKFETGDDISETPAIGPDGTIYLGADDSYLYAINPDGSLKWKFTPPDQGYRYTFSSPTISADGTIYVGCNDGFLYALAPDSSVKWKYKISSHDIVENAAIGSDGTIYAITYLGLLSAFGGSGHAVWPPSHPRNLQVKEEGGKMVLSWDAPGDTGNSQITTYRIYRSVFATGEGGYIGNVSGNTFRYEDTFHLKSGETYYYYVTAVNEAGESRPSDKVNITMKGEETGGGVPGGGGSGMPCLIIAGLQALIAIAAVLFLRKRKYRPAQAGQFHYQNPPQEMMWNSAGIPEPVEQGPPENTPEQEEQYVF